MTLPADIVIRTAAPADAGALRELRVEALRLHPIDLTADLSETESRPAAFWSELAARSAGDGREVIMLAVAAGSALAGMAGVYTEKQPKLEHVGIVWGDYVREPYRRRGVAGALVRACIDWARTRPLVTLKLGVTASSAARRFYDETLMALRL